METQPFRFDLQLFADGVEAQETGAETQGQGGEGQGGEAQTGGTILGNTGQEQTGNAPDSSQGGAQEAQAPEAYDFTSVVPEGQEYDAQRAQEFGAIARECGLTQEQASKVAAYGMQYMQQGVAAAMQEIQATYTRWGEEAKSQLGADFDKTVAKAAVGIDRLSQKIPGLRQMFNETGVGNRIEMIKFMAEIGEMVGEDGGHGVPGYGGGKSLYPNTNFGQYK